MSNINYKKIKPKKIYEEVAEAIHEMIRQGQLKPGDRLDSVQQLSENFQVGRSAIREALSALRAIGLVEMRQGEGTYVKEFEAAQINFPLSTAILMNKKDVAHLLGVRKILEAGAAAAAAVQRTNEDLAALSHALDEMKQAHGNEELGEKADLEFHLALAAASQNPLLASLMSHVSGLMVETMKETRRLWLFSRQTTTELLYNEHLAIFEAVKNQEEEAARSTILAHLNNVETILSKYWQETGTMERDDVI